MKYVFFGTPRFAEIVLEGLLKADFIPAAIVCNPDRPMGRKKVLTPPFTKQFVNQRKLPIKIMQPEKLDEALIWQLREFHPDLFIVAAYAKIIPDVVLSIPQWGTLGTHPSLLPLYRGASPIQSVILTGEQETGSTIYQMDAKMDHGPIVAQSSLYLDPLKTNYLQLESSLAMISAELLIAAIPKVLDRTVQTKVQDEASATFTKKFQTQDAFIESSLLENAVNGDTKQAEIIMRAINALNPEPGVWTMRDDKRVKLLEASIANGRLKLSKIQVEGERPKQS
jgi:methionyl-tRNA formyltransferase